MNCPAIERMNESSELPNKRYVYEQLNHKDSFRLLKLMPSTCEGELLKCDLVQFRLSERPSYETISYVQNFHAHDQYIQIKDSLLSISPHLESTLRSFVEKDRPRYIWVGAICTDKLEKNDEIFLITNIVSRSSCLLIWLGMNTDDTK